MKKIALLLLCSAFIAAVQAKDVTKNLTLTKGVMTTINPVSDLGLKVTTDNVKKEEEKTEKKKKKKREKKKKTKKKREKKKKMMAMKKLCKKKKK